MEHLFEEDDYFVKENIKPNDAEKLQGICEWYNERCDEIEDGKRTVMMGEKYVIIEWSWDDYCRGCFMDTIYESVTIPNEIFYSNYNLDQWQKEEKARNDATETEKKKKKATVDALIREKKKISNAKRKEEKDRAEFERLKQKYKGE